ncbi:endonuclease/exonuclease/phosphatase family protein [Chitinophaga caeni]|nr:endonuclease/exonuclease/phosphatase family protein [Chitinophaga caeni]
MKRFALFMIMAVGSNTLIKAQNTPQHLSVLSYNIHHAENNNGELDISGIAKVILAYNPDVVALQEVDSMTTRTKQVDQLKELASLTGMYIYFSKAMDLQGGGYGTGVLSKFPIDSSYSIPLPSKNPKAEPRTAAVTRLVLPDDSLFNFVSTHLDFNEDGIDRTEQMNILYKHFEPGITPTIIAGDFNTVPGSKEMLHFKKLYHDVTEFSGPTHPADSPKIKIDYIFVHPASRFNIIKSKVIEETIASDHRPVMCELEIN